MTGEIMSVGSLTWASSWIIPHVCRHAQSPQPRCLALIPTEKVVAGATFLGLVLTFALRVRPNEALPSPGGASTQAHGDTTPLLLGLE